MKFVVAAATKAIKPPRDPPAVLRKKLIELDGDDVDAIIQVGTNLSMVRLAAHRDLLARATPERITDKIAGLGRLLEEF
jgi:maleate isomerase